MFSLVLCLYPCELRFHSCLDDTTSRQPIWTSSSRPEACLTTLVLPTSAVNSSFQIFQLLLPEMDQNKNNALWLLLALCAVAPVLAWGSRLRKRENAATRNTPEARYIISSTVSGTFSQVQFVNCAVGTRRQPDTVCAVNTEVAETRIPPTVSCTSVGSRHKCFHINIPRYRHTMRHCASNCIDRRRELDCLRSVSVWHPSSQSTVKTVKQGLYQPAYGGWLTELKTPDVSVRVVVHPFNAIH